MFYIGWGNRLRTLNRLSVVLVLLLTLLAGGCDDGAFESRTGIDDQAASSASSGFTGVFHQSADGNRSVLNLTDRGGVLTGMADAHAINGTVSGNSATGEIRHAGTAVTLGTASLTLSGNTLTLAMTAVDHETGSRHEVPIRIYTRGPPPPIEVQRDAQLVGRWRHALAGQESSEDSPAGDLWLILDRDGGAGHGRSSGHPTALLGLQRSGDDRLVGRWRSGGQMLYLLPTGSEQWVPFARYRVETGRLVLTFNDGTTRSYEPATSP
jgi:hypothetical protein